MSTYKDGNGTRNERYLFVVNMNTWIIGTRLELDIVQGGIGFTVKAKSDLGEREGFFELDPSIKSRMYDIQEAVDKQTSLDNEFVEEFGKKLFRMLFTNLKDLFHECVAHSDHWMWY